ncbi:MAG: CRISPR-associated protein Cas4 [Deltaproteobacteria bacterium]|uniref:CRISPR-associated protein Cas4 n=1 Tax=Desulfobacula sp. TaxID=2593537 RepID=UPI0019A40C0B|nr:CRISPR-associated protein Cas4 [Candidatus Desulfobacula maris]MBL6995236.1 CRISPR-associated protein Cas4 [Desulfobacula sp.]
MTEDSDLIPLSALQHYLFCPRQCALIHIERQWFENRFTAEGKVMHDRVDKGGDRDRGSVRIEYSLPLVCHELGLVGQADVVEFHLTDKDSNAWVPYPVEYKRGKPKKDNSDKVQLCAQALCLEEMYQRRIPEGALFYGKTRRRQQVLFNSELRQETVDTARQLHTMILDRITPEPVYDKKCESCSFLDFCLPRVCKRKSVKNYLKKMME